MILSNENHVAVVVDKEEAVDLRDAVMAARQILLAHHSDHGEAIRLNKILFALEDDLRDHIHATNND